MIPFDFAYYRPETVDEAWGCYFNLVSANKKPLYYAGGTEIISMARVNSSVFDAVIDLKGIPACHQLTLQDGAFIIGSTQTLTRIAEFGAYPLLSQTVKRIADHTIQGQITIGGNLAGTVKYREAALPLMISNCRVKIMTRDGLLEMPFLQIFDGRLRLKEGEFLVSLTIDENDLQLPYNHVKKTKMAKIDYPLITLAAMKKGPEIKAAMTGYGDKPLLLPADMLNNDSLPPAERITNMIKLLRDDCKSDLSGSKEYKEFVLQGILEQLFKNFAEGS